MKTKNEKEAIENRFSKKIWRVIDSERNRGITFASMLGVLDMIKDDLIRENYAINCDDAEGELDS